VAHRTGIVFDNDGLLLDTEPCWTRAEVAVFERHGHEFDLDAKRALVGTAPETAACSRAAARAPRARRGARR
jgi:beta-phosphoglucomutase-like phosphatase (HAD superfamily)